MWYRRPFAPQLQGKRGTFSRQWFVQTQLVPMTEVETPTDMFVLRQPVTLTAWLTDWLCTKLTSILIRLPDLHFVEPSFGSSVEHKGFVLSLDVDTMRFDLVDNCDHGAYSTRFVQQAPVSYICPGAAFGEDSSYSFWIHWCENLVNQIGQSAHQIYPLWSYIDYEWLIVNVVAPEICLSLIHVCFEEMTPEKKFEGKLEKLNSEFYHIYSFLRLRETSNEKQIFRHLLWMIVRPNVFRYMPDMCSNKNHIRTALSVEWLDSHISLSSHLKIAFIYHIQVGGAI